MAYRVPYIEVTGPSGVNLVPIWGTALVAVRVISYLDVVADELTLTFGNPFPYKAPPPQGTRFAVRLGWSQAEAVDRGSFIVQRLHLSGSPAAGERLALICRSADLVKFNEVDSRHYDADNGNATLGQTLRNMLAGTGLPVEVSPAIDGKPLPSGYALRWNQTGLDAAQDLAADNRAVVKVAGDRILVIARDLGESVSGKGLGPIAIDHDACYEYDVEIEPRFAYASVGVTWFDPDLGRLQRADSATSAGGGQAGGLPHPAASREAALALGDAYDAELGRSEFTGMFVCPGLPGASAGAFVTTTGFPPPIDGTRLQCETLTDDVTPDRGWTTTVEVQQVPG